MAHSSKFVPPDRARLHDLRIVFSSFRRHCRAPRAQRIGAEHGRSGTRAGGQGADRGAQQDAPRRQSRCGGALAQLPPTSLLSLWEMWTSVFMKIRTRNTEHGLESDSDLCQVSLLKDITYNIYYIYITSIYSV